MKQAEILWSAKIVRLLEVVRGMKEKDMTDYISRQAAIDWTVGFVQQVEKTEDICIVDPAGWGSDNPVRNYVTEAMTDTIPAADVVEVVRCRDCKYWDGEIRDGFYYFEHCSLINEDRISDDYCSYGERADK